jgi:phosphatidylethanolamine-binding protein (PEBP) family uncharacterized protein
MRTISTAVAVMVTVTGCASLDTSKLPRMDLDFAFDQKHKCKGVSPELRLSDVPASVASYEIKLTDLDFPIYPHWSQTLPSTAGPVIAEAVGTGYFGPCPPFGTHRYRISVVARDAGKQAVGYAEKTVVTGK